VDLTPIQWKVLEFLGRGGMGLVLKARDPALDRMVAIKVLTPALAHGATARRRFAREARAVAAVGNDHIVAIHAVDEFRGLPYLVMLYAMAAGRPPFRADSALAVLKRVCEIRHRPVRELNPDVPDWLEAVIDRLLAKDPADRFETATEVADLLECGLAHLQQPGTVPPPTVPAVNPQSTQLLDFDPAVTKSVPRSRRRLALVAAHLLLIGAGLGASEAAGLTQVSDIVAAILRIKTPEGTLVIKCGDPNMSVQLDGKDVVIAGSGLQELRLRTGLHRLAVIKDGRSVREDLVSVAHCLCRRLGRPGLVLQPPRQEGLSPPAVSRRDSHARREPGWLDDRGGGQGDDDPGVRRRDATTQGHTGGAHKRCLVARLFTRRQAARLRWRLHREALGYGDLEEFRRAYSPFPRSALRPVLARRQDPRLREHGPDREALGRLDRSAPRDDRARRTRQERGETSGAPGSMEEIKEYPQFEPALSLLPAVPPEEAIALLNSRGRRLGQMCAVLRAAIELALCH